MKKCFFFLRCAWALCVQNVHFLLDWNLSLLDFRQDLLTEIGCFVCFYSPVIGFNVFLLSQSSTVSFWHHAMVTAVVMFDLWHGSAFVLNTDCSCKRQISAMRLKLTKFGMRWVFFSFAESGWTQSKCLRLRLIFPWKFSHFLMNIFSPFLQFFYRERQTGDALLENVSFVGLSVRWCEASPPEYIECRNKSINYAYKYKYTYI